MFRISLTSTVPDVPAWSIQNLRIFALQPPVEAALHWPAHDRVDGQHRRQLQPPSERAGSPDVCATTGVVATVLQGISRISRTGVP
jgi:hypothetical protein